MQLTALSPYNPKLDLADVIVYDSTLRDGEQTPGMAFTNEQKVEIARKLDELGVHTIEAGFPVISQYDEEAVQAVARERLNAFARTNDGFKIAEEDLRLRGPGEFFGTRQSGMPDLRAANILRDADLLEKARSEAFELVKQETGLARYPRLTESLLRKWQGRLGLISVG